MNCLGENIGSHCWYYQIKEFFTDSKNPFQWSPSYPPRRSEEWKFFLTKGGGSNTDEPIMVANFVNRHKPFNKDMVNIHTWNRIFFNMKSFTGINLEWELENVQQLIKRLFPSKNVPNVLIARRLKYFSKHWKKINQRLEYPGVSRWWCNIFSKKTFSINDSCPIGYNLRTTKTDGHGKEGNIEEDW